ncbi:TPA: DNA-binding protein [Klebsiella oxytoca]|uniref:DNA-binding protein n=1 Tax=Klebsiella oxytoca TaxID=571 RepID=A0AAN5RCI3_KLEOX|nr:DNA-binding protein [Klebsiella oxytoca]
MKLYDFIVGSGEDIREAVTRFVLSKKWHGAYITGAVGSVTDMSFTTPISNKLPPETQVFTVEGAAEVVSFTGEVMLRDLMDPSLKTIYPDTENPLFVHIHTSCAYEGGKVCGGGLAAGKAFRSVRVFLVCLDK